MVDRWADCGCGMGEKCQSDGEVPPIPLVDAPPTTWVGEALAERDSRIEWLQAHAMCLALTEVCNHCERPRAGFLHAYCEGRGYSYQLCGRVLDHEGDCGHWMSYPDPEVFERAVRGQVKNPPD